MLRPLDEQIEELLQPMELLAPPPPEEYDGDQADDAAASPASSVAVTDSGASLPRTNLTSSPVYSSSHAPSSSLLRHSSSPSRVNSCVPLSFVVPHGA